MQSDGLYHKKRARTHIRIEWWIVKTSHTRLIVYVCVRAGMQRKLSLTPINIPIRMSAFHVFSNNASTIKHMFLIHIISFHSIWYALPSLTSFRHRYSKAREKAYIILCIFGCDFPYGCLPFDLHHMLCCVYGWVHFLFLSFRFIGFFPIFYLHSVTTKEPVIALRKREKEEKEIWADPSRTS